MSKISKSMFFELLGAINDGKFKEFIENNKDNDGYIVAAAAIELTNELLNDIDSQVFVSLYVDECTGVETMGFSDLAFEIYRKVPDEKIVGLYKAIKGGAK